ncbi:MAG: aminotransferase class V-fold PLP-dependent enzyme, partial [Alphaproteobacteria bacterium]
VGMRSLELEREDAALARRRPDQPQRVDPLQALERVGGEFRFMRLQRINSLRLIGTAPGKGGIFSFELKGAHAHDVSTILDRYGIAVRAGTHCAMPLLQRFGVTSTCRASFGLYTGKDDIDALVEGIEKARSFFS